MFLGPFKLPCSFPSKTIGVVLAVLLLVVWKEREREKERKERERERESMLARHNVQATLDRRYERSA